jgi:hypothetical protein
MSPATVSLPRKTQRSLPPCSVLIREGQTDKPFMNSKGIKNLRGNFEFSGWSFNPCKKQR